jgi:hypothetical protein
LIPDAVKEEEHKVDIEDGVDVDRLIVNEHK